MNAENAKRPILIALALQGLSGAATAFLVLGLASLAVSPATAAVVGARALAGPPGFADRVTLTGMNPRLSAAVPRNLEGYSVAISGPTAVVGLPGLRKDAGAAYIYIRENGQWHHEATLTDPRNADNDVFGGAVSMVSTADGTYVVIGDQDPYSVGNGRPDVVYVYKGSGRTWRRQETLRNPDKSSASIYDAFGGSVSISPTALVIGAPGYGNTYDYGAAYIYMRSGSRWILRASLNDPVSRPEPLDTFGQSVAVSGRTVIIGATDASYVYTRTSGNGWPLTAKLRNPGPRRDNFGASVSLSGLTALIGAPGNQEVGKHSAGAAYIFTKSGGSWKLWQKIPALGRGDEFGFSAAISDERVLIGMPLYGKARCGSVYELKRSDRKWIERSLLVDPHCAGEVQFGFSVAVSGATALIGAPFTNVQGGAAFAQNLP
jgi:FG-GAP repeat